MQGQKSTGSGEAAGPRRNSRQEPHPSRPLPVSPHPASLILRGVIVRQVVGGCRDEGPPPESGTIRFLFLSRLCPLSVRTRFGIRLLRSPSFNAFAGSLRLCRKRAEEAPHSSPPIGEFPGRSARREARYESHDCWHQPKSHHDINTRTTDTTLMTINLLTFSILLLVLHGFGVFLVLASSLPFPWKSSEPRPHELPFLSHYLSTGLSRG
jgi:hypothetical protein